jgi:hypothetical protein
MASAVSRGDARFAPAWQNFAQVGCVARPDVTRRDTVPAPLETTFSNGARSLPTGRQACLYAPLKISRSHPLAIRLE